MSKIFKTGLLSAAAMALATTAMAGQVDNQTYEVNVDIEVAEEVSMWAGHEDVLLEMKGNDGNNSATFESTISTINNVPAAVSATVDGTLPTPIVAGGGINFFIFKQGDATDAVNAITANAYTPAGALVWNQASLGTTQEFDGAVPVHTSVDTRPIVYASASPGELPLPNTYDLTVTWTIAPQP